MTTRSSKITVAPQNERETSRKKEHYPCFCEVAELALFFGRAFGTSPIAKVKSYLHGQRCRFVVSKSWRNYAIGVQVIFIIYAVILHGVRLWCGPTISNTKFWYVMTTGYIIGDVDALSCMSWGLICAQRLCKLLETLARIDGPYREMKNLMDFFKKIICVVILSFFLAFLSYLYVALLRSFVDEDFYYNHCNIPDYPFAVIGRGCILVFPCVGHLIISLLCMVIRNKFKHLTEKTDLTIAVYSSVSASAKCAPNSLDQLANDHKQIYFCLREVNACFGLQLLVGTSSVLFTTIYFLYRYSISSRETVLSNTNERLHYIVGIFYRMGNLLHYMYLGKQISFWSQAPLRVLQNANLLNLPYKTQQQVHTLMLQWSGKVGHLSAMEVINMGPWLLAPIVGNVITYLLIALQFENSNQLPLNTTVILETVL